MHTMVRKSWGAGTPSREDIATAALELIDAGGLDEFSMRKLAAEMGVHPNALYRRVSSRDEILDLVADAVLGEVRVPRRRGTWQDFLVDLAVRMRTAILAHPNCGPLLNTMTTGMPALFHLEDAIFGALTDAGYHGADLLLAHTTYMGFVLGASVVEAMQRPGTVGSPPAAREPTAQERATFPRLAAAYDEIEALEPLPANFEANLFRAGIEAVLAGLS